MMNNSEIIPGIITAAVKMIKPLDAWPVSARVQMSSTRADLKNRIL